MVCKRYNYNSANSYIWVVKSHYWLNINVLGNYIGENGAKSICESLKTNTTLTSIDLSGM